MDPELDVQYVKEIYLDREKLVGSENLLPELKKMTLAQPAKKESSPSS